MSCSEAGKIKSASCQECLGDSCEMQYMRDELSAMTQRAEATEAENAELMRKLAESEKARRQYFGEMCEVIEKNDKLLAEAKSKEVEEAYQRGRADEAYDRN